MRFNRERFIDETSGNLDSAFDCIDQLLSILQGYIVDDEMAGMYRHGCYGKGAKAQIYSVIKDTVIDEYIDR